jgi:hypothetical protein
MLKYILFIFFHETAFGLTANWVKWEFHPSFYRIVIEYTIPELKERREAIIELLSKKKAEVFYSYILRGGEFYIKNKDVYFIQNPKTPSPW